MRGPDSALLVRIICVLSLEPWRLRRMDGRSVWVTLPLRETAGEYTTLNGMDDGSREDPEMSWSPRFASSAKSFEASALFKDS